MKAIKTLVTVIVVGLAIYVWRAPLYTVYAQTYAVLFPCRQSITYRLGNIDPQFGLATSTAFADIKEAAQLWNDEHKDLLLYDPRGMVVINFEYDTRQETTQKLSTAGVAVSEDRAVYDALKATYTSVYSDYAQKKAAFAVANDALQKSAAQYQSEVDSWNARGGAPKNVYQQLQTEKAHLTALQDQLRQSQVSINAQVDLINATVAQLNTLAKSLNLDVSAYNTIGSAAGGEFEQGVYESSLGTRTITIFEYENHLKLVRVLAHEMGHAIGLEHVDDENAIMAAVNQGAHIALTLGDAKELDAVCRRNPFIILKTKVSDYVSSFSRGDQ